MPLRFSILDQSPISQGQTASEALADTVQLAQHAEQWGYTRFWVSEHHDAKTLAGSSPEILISHIGARTSSIRLGSGGVMLPHYSAFKVAENFNLLENLYPGRIDAGVGRAPGGMPRASFALSNGRLRDAGRFPEQLDELRMYLENSIPESHDYYGMTATPVPPEAPPIWMLGSGEGSSQLAAEKGLPYMFAHFINGEGGQDFAANYRKNSFHTKEIDRIPGLRSLPYARKLRSRRNMSHLHLTCRLRWGRRACRLTVHRLLNRLPLTNTRNSKSCSLKITGGAWSSATLFKW